MLHGQLNLPTDCRWCIVNGCGAVFEDKCRKFRFRIWDCSPPQTSCRFSTFKEAAWAAGWRRQAGTRQNHMLHHSQRAHVSGFQTLVQETHNSTAVTATFATWLGLILLNKLLYNCVGAPSLTLDNDCTYFCLCRLFVMIHLFKQLDIMTKAFIVCNT